MKAVGSREEVYLGLARATGYGSASLKKEDIVFDEETNTYLSKKGWEAKQKRVAREAMRLEKKASDPCYTCKYGSRSEVWSGIALMTTSGLKKGDLLEKDGEIVSIREANMGGPLSGGEVVIDGVKYRITLSPI